MNEPATLALGLRSTPQSLGVIGKALGLFEAAGVDLTIARAETAGPQGIKGLVQGEYQFAELGAVPAVQAALEGHDPLVIFAVEPYSAMFLLGGRGHGTRESLAGQAIGVLSRDGQTGVSARRLLARWQIADLTKIVECGTYPSIYAALADGSIAAGVLTADYWIAGREQHDLSLLADFGREFQYQGPVLATTKRVRDANPAMVQRVVDGYLATLHRFKTDADAVVPPLMAHLGFVDEAQARAIQGFYRGRFQAVPTPSRAGMQRVIDSFEPRYAHAKHMTAQDIVDGRFVDTAVAQRKDSKQWI